MDLVDALPDRPFTTAEAAAMGVDRSALSRLVRSGRLRRPLRGVYVKPGLPDDVASRCCAAKLVIGPTAVACDRTAAWIWGVDVFGYDEQANVPPLETYVVRGRNRTRRQECAGGVRDLADSDVVEVQGLRVTTPLRTALDLACKLSRRDALAALDAFMRVHGLTQRDLQRGLNRYFRRRGVVQARELVRLADPRSESPGESWTRLEVIDHGLPVPRPQLWVYEDGMPLYRLDLGWRRRKVAAEYDGREHHADDEKRRERDEARRDWLEREGWTIVVVRAEDFTRERIDEWIGELRDALR